MKFVVLIILAFLSFFFSGSEAALTSLPEYKLKKIYVKYKILRFPLNLWILKPYRFLISILIGNTIVNLLFSSTITEIFVTQLPYVNKELKETIVWLGTTFLIILFCELTPKIISKNFSETVSSIVILPLTFLQYLTFLIFSPILFFVEKYLMKEKDVYKVHFVKIDEIKNLIAQTTKGIFQKRDFEELFDRVSKFDEIRIKDIYIPKENVIAVDISNKSISQIISEVIDSGKTRVPVYKEAIDKILGYILIKDVFYLCSQEHEFSITDLIHPILEVGLNEKAKDVLKKMQNSQIHIAAVKDKNNKFCGIVTLEDILEEIVGDILDEYDIRKTIKQ
jgi:CBS domain containing-hemolysin-like protein